jgi:hypothetical protein
VTAQPESAAGVRGRPRTVPEDVAPVPDVGGITPTPFVPLIGVMPTEMPPPVPVMEPGPAPGAEPRVGSPQLPFAQAALPGHTAPVHASRQAPFEQI